MRWWCITPTAGMTESFPEVVRNKTQRMTLQDAEFGKSEEQGCKLMRWWCTDTTASTASI